MYNVKILKILLMASTLVLSAVYTIYPRLNVNISEPLEKYTRKTFIEYYNGTEDFLINTPGCYIPNYMKSMKINESKYAKKTCGERAIFLEKISNDIMFKIDEKKMTHYTRKKYMCCYQFASPSIILEKKDYTSIRYSNCKYFKNGTTTQLLEEIITVRCTLKSATKKSVYEDAYAILKQVNINRGKSNETSFNVLILGMDTMSRARAYSSMPKTTEYMLRHNWLDYRGYQKVGYNTFPNVMALLTGMKISSIYAACASGMDHCNDRIIWSDFKKAGYVTATGEEYLRLPDTFAKLGYKSPPTDHYLRPLFLTGENMQGNYICTKKMPSVHHMLDYATTFAETYKEDKFFGMFWFNSYSHNLENIPQLIDDRIVNFFNKLDESGLTNRTFIMFLSDHGLRYGKMRIAYESYYEERLPMLFLWVPYDFRKLHYDEYKNLKINQNRLVTPYDLRLTLWDTMMKSKMVNNGINSEACPNCVSMFNEISPYRSCADASVDEKWCTCHQMNNVELNNTDAHRSVKLVVDQLQNRMKNIKTIPCMKCIVLKLKTILRIHTYQDESLNSTYFILGIVMTPGDVSYEATIVKRNGELIIMGPTYTISPYNTRGSCVIEPNNRSYCVCEKSRKCNKNKH